MPINFSDTLAAIHADLNQRTLIFSFILGGLLLLWIGWLLLMPMAIVKHVNGFVEINQSGNLRIVALFKSVDAKGYLGLGQKAKIYIESAPRLQYGAVNAEIVQIDQSEQQDIIRVVLTLENTSHLALQHGMSTVVSVTVATATPWQLLLQSLGSHQINF